MPITTTNHQTIHVTAISIRCAEPSPRHIHKEIKTNGNQNYGHENVDAKDAGWGEFQLQCMQHIWPNNLQIVMLVNTYNQQLPFVTIVYYSMRLSHILGWGLMNVDDCWCHHSHQWLMNQIESTHATFPNNTLSLCSKAKAASSVTKFGLFECHLSLDLLLKCAGIREYTHVLVPKQQSQRTSRQSQTELDYAIYRWNSRKHLKPLLTW